MWGSENWGEMVWGPVPGVPLMGPLGFAGIAICFLVVGFVMLRRDRPRWVTYLAAAGLLVLAPFAVYEGSTAGVSTFVNGPVAGAEEVNANFAAGKLAVDKSDGRIQRSKP